MWFANCKTSHLSMEGVFAGLKEQKLTADGSASDAVHIARLLQDYLHSLVTQGIINDQLAKVVTQKCLDGPDFIVRRIPVYTNDAYTLLLEMKHFIDLPDVDFTKLAGHAQMLHGKSSRIGAEHMRLACTGLIQACAEKDRSKISRVLTWTETEFDKTWNALESIAQGLEYYMLMFLQSGFTWIL
ncbi:Histidine-containing phosphotransfer protein 1-like protein [Drosera capensis]